MGKIKKYFDEQKEMVMDVCKRYMTTWIYFGLVCLTLVFYDIVMDYQHGDTIERICCVLSIAGCVSFLLESILDGDLKDKVLEKTKWDIKATRTVSAIIAFIIGLAYEIILDKVVDNVEEVTSEIITRWLVYFVFVFILLGFYFTIKNTELEIGSYFRTAIGNIGHLVATWGLINIGIFLILGLFDSLIFSIHFSDWMGNIELIIVAVIYIPLALFAITDKREYAISKGSMIFYRLALMPMVFAATVIIYLYIFKIILGLADSSNVIYSPCMWLFIIGAPIWEMADLKELEEDSSLWNKIIKKMRYIYAPLVLLELYAIGIRIAEYGLSGRRYMAIMFIIFQLIYIFWSWGEKVKLLLVVIGLLTIGVVAPLINGFYTCFMSQRAIFAKYYDKAIEIGEKYDLENENIRVDISDEDRKVAKRFNGAYSYLRYDARGEKYLKDNYNIDSMKETMNKVHYIASSSKYGNSDYDYEQREYKSFSCTQENDVNISGYKGMNKIRHNNYDYISLSTFSSYKIRYANESKEITVDLSNVINMMDKEYQYNEHADTPIEVSIGSDKKLVITEISYTKILNKSQYTSIRVEGYLLTK